MDKHENARLFILGEGTLKNELEDLINKLNLNENVFLSRCSGKRVSLP